MPYEINVSLDAKQSGKDIAWHLKSSDVVHAKKGPVDQNYWCEVASHIGELVPMEEDEKGNKTGRLFTDIKYPWDSESKSFSHSNTRQPFHTDGSYESAAPPITFFCCMETPYIGGATTFIRLPELIYILKNYATTIWHDINNVEVTHSKGNDSKTRPILHEDKLTWNYYRCEECRVRDELHEFLENYVVGGGIYQSVKLMPGEALFFQDEKLLHGRMAFLGNRWLVKGGIHV